MNFDEAGVIQLLSGIFGSNHRGVDIGIGDDGAVVKTSDRTVITNDVAVEEHIFKPSGATPLRSDGKLQQPILQMFMQWADSRSIW